MSIGSVPANSTKAGAVEFTLNMDILVWETTQITSWWPGAGAFVPGSSVATSFDLWFKFKLPKKFYEYYNTIGVTVQNIGNTGYQPSGTTDASLCYVVTELDEQLLWGAGRGQIHTLRNVDKYYYIQVSTPNQNRVPETKMKIHVDTFMRKVSTVGAIAVQDTRQLGAIVVANLTPPVIGPNSSVDVAHIWVAEDGHSVGGVAGDVSISGYTCIQDSALAADGVTVRSRNYKDPFSFSNLGTSTVIRRSASSGNTFWMGINPNNSTIAHIRSVTVGPSGTSSAVLSAPIVMQVPVIRDDAISDLVALAQSGDIIYFAFRYETSVRRFSISANSEISPLVPSVSIMINVGGSTNIPENPLYYGTVWDILVAPNGDVLVAYYDELPAITFPPNLVYPPQWRPFSVKRYNSAGAFLGNVINVSHQEGERRHHRMNYSEDPNFFYIWTHFVSSGYNSSGFGKVRIGDGLFMGWFYAYEFYDGALMYTGSLYTGNRTPAASWGTNQISNFWVNPLDIAVPAIPPDPIILPPPGPGEPPLNPAGGGLLMLDPGNRVRHDVYMDKAGAQYDSTIPVTITTAFLGD